MTRSLLLLIILYTVGIYSPGKAFVVYEIKRHVLPTALSYKNIVSYVIHHFCHHHLFIIIILNETSTYPSPTTTHLIDCIYLYIYILYIY